MNSFLKILVAVMAVAAVFSFASIASAAINITFHPNSTCTASDDDTLDSGVVACAKATGLGTEHIHHIEIYNPSNVLFAQSTSGTGNREVSFTPVGCGVWTAKVVTDADSTVQAERTFTIGNCAPTTATLTLVKEVVNDDGGSTLATAWTLSASGATPISGTTGAAAVTAAVINPGAYNLSESGGPAGYSASSWGCSGTGTQNDGDTVTLLAGQSATCTITNNDNQAYIIVDKTVVNDNGGTADEDDFLLTVDGNAALDGVAVPVNPGLHTVGETNLPGYTAGTWGGDCTSNGSVTVALGETKTCTITNNDNAGTLIVRKIVTNNNGGTATADGFSFTVNGDSSNAFEADGENQMAVNAGSYGVVENAAAGYVATYSNSLNQNADCSNLSIGLGETVICTITNDDIKTPPPPPPPHDTGDQCRADIVITNGGSINSSTWSISRTGGNSAGGSHAGDDGEGGNGGSGGSASANSGNAAGGAGGSGGSAHGGDAGRGGSVVTGNATSNSATSNILNRVNVLLRR